MFPPLFGSNVPLPSTFPSLVLTYLFVTGIVHVDLDDNRGSCRDQSPVGERIGRVVREHDASEEVPMTGEDHGAPWDNHR